jgi:tetratricopeptide (TPR) repeat protein
LFRMKKFEDAEPVLRSAIKVNGKSPVVHYYLGRLLTSLDRFDEAEKELKNALSLSNDQMPEVHRMLANLYLTKGDNKRARETLETYLELVPNAPDAELLRKLITQLRNSKTPANSPNPKP